MPLHAGWVGTRLSCARPRVVRAHVLAIAALALCAAGARAQNFSTPKDISGDMPGGRPLIAVDSKNNIDIAWSTSKGVFFTRSTDAGKTFADSGDDFRRRGQRRFANERGCEWHHIPALAGDRFALIAKALDRCGFLFFADRFNGDAEYGHLAGRADDGARQRRQH